MSRHDWKIVDWDVKHQPNQNKHPIARSQQPRVGAGLANSPCQLIFMSSGVCRASEIFIFLLKIKFPPYMPINFVMKGKLLFSDIGVYCFQPGQLRLWANFKEEHNFAGVGGGLYWKPCLQPNSCCLQFLKNVTISKKYFKLTEIPSECQIVWVHIRPEV